MRKNFISKRVLALMLSTVMTVGPSLTAVAANLGGVKLNGKDLKTVNLTSPNKSTTLYEFKINPPKSGTYTDTKTGFQVTVTFDYEKGEAKKVTWSSNYPVYSMLVKGGKKGGNLYKYNDGAKANIEIITPDNQGVGHGHATFYYCIPTPNPPVTEPEVTNPPVTEPEVTNPPVTDPEVTNPPVTEPEVTNPPVTEPEVTNPPVTEPEVTNPPVTEPEVTNPPVTEPAEQELSIIDLSQVSGFVTGGNYVTINGTGFQPGVIVTLGGKNATVVNYYSSTQIRVAIPEAITEETVDLVVTNSNGQVVSLASAYTYLALPAVAPPTITSLSKIEGLISGGDYVVITGTDFQKGLTVTLGGVNATVVNYYNATQIRIAIPQALEEGPVDLLVTNPDGQAASLASAYTYSPLPAIPAPTITSLSKTEGLTIGGDYVVVNGTGFQKGITVTLGGINATVVNYYSSTQIRIIIPTVANAGVVDLQITNPDAQSTVLSSAYTYNTPVTTITSLSASIGEYSGGYSTYIYGTNFDPNSVVTVNDIPVTITYYSTTQIRILTMPSAESLGLPNSGGIATIKVADTLGNSNTVNFTYKAKPITPVPKITKMVGAGGASATGSIAGGNFMYFTGTGFTSTMKVRIYDSSNILVSEVALTNFYSDTYSRLIMPKVTTAGNYTIKLVNIDGIESNGMTYIYK